jgi:acyl-coenzyme A synthetase/AMP-(fatty) acid ligase
LRSHNVSAFFLLQVRGLQVSPAELEAILMRHPAVEDAIVVGRPSQRWGELPVAFVKLCSGAADSEGGTPTPGALLAFVDGFVSEHKRLEEVKLVHELPRKGVGKALRSELLKRLY